MTNPDRIETAQWWHALVHNSPAVLAGTLVSLAVVSVMDWYTWPLAGSVLSMLVALGLYARHTVLGPLKCGRCLMLTAAVDDDEVYRNLWHLRTWHWFALRGGLLAMGLLSAASPFIPDPLGNWILAGCDLVLAYHFWGADVHRRLTPWCPWCRRRWGWGDAAPVDEPVPTGSGDRS